MELLSRKEEKEN